MLGTGITRGWLIALVIGMVTAGLVAPTPQGAHAQEDALFDESVTLPGTFNFTVPADTVMAVGYDGTATGDPGEQTLTVRNAAGDEVASQTSTNGVINLSDSVLVDAGSYQVEVAFGNAITATARLQAKAAEDLVLNTRLPIGFGPSGLLHRFQVAADDTGVAFGVTVDFDRDPGLVSLGVFDDGFDEVAVIDSDENGQIDDARTTLRVITLDQGTYYLRAFTGTGAVGQGTLQAISASPLSLGQTLGERFGEAGVLYAVDVPQDGPAAFGYIADLTSNPGLSGIALDNNVGVLVGEIIEDDGDGQQSLSIGLRAGRYFLRSYADSVTSGPGEVQAIGPTDLPLGVALTVPFGPAGALLRLEVAEAGTYDISVDPSLVGTTESETLLVRDAGFSAILARSDEGVIQNLALQPGTYYVRFAVDGQAFGSTAIAAWRSGELSPLAPPDAVPVEVLAVEVNQAVQDWAGSVPLVAERRTGVRVFAKLGATSPDASRAFYARLRVTQDGVERFNQTSANIVTLSTADPLRDDASADALREDINGAFYWSLPASVLAEGQVELTLEIVGKDTIVVCGDAMRPQGLACVTERAIEPQVPDMALHLVGVRYTSDDGTDVETDLAIQIDQLVRVLDALPTSRVDIESNQVVDMTDLGRTPTSSEVTSRLVELREDDGNLINDDERFYYYGVIRDDPDGSNGSGGVAESVPEYADNLTDARGYASSGFVGGRGDAQSGYARNRGVHEILHTFGFPHAASSYREITGTDDDGNPLTRSAWFGVCPGGNGFPATASSDEDADERWPELLPFPHIYDVDGVERPTLGPMGDSATEVWGLTPGRDPFSTARAGVISPQTTFDLMSYCNGTGQSRWTSGTSYALALDVLAGDREGTDFTGAAVGTPTRQAADPVDVVTVVPTIVDGGPVTVAPLFLGESTPTPDDPNGRYLVELLGAGGVVLDSRRVDAEPATPDREGPDADNPPETVIFGVSLPLPGQPIEGLRVSLDGSVIHNQTATAAAPSVEVTNPPAGTVLDGQAVIRWNADDSDSPTVWARVEIQHEPGSAWQTITSRTTARQLAIDTDRLMAAGAARLRVQVSDGIRFTSDEVGPLSVADPDPRIEIVEPSVGDTVASTDVITLLSVADVPGDEAPTVSWSSNVDGGLGEGDELLLEPNRLTAGPHTLTALATTLSGTTVTATVEVVIADRIATESLDTVAQAIAVSRRAFPDSADVVVLGRDDNFADSLASGFVQGQVGGPLLLTPSAFLDGAVRAEISRLEATEVVIMGGRVAISEQIETELIDAGIAVTRIAGATRTQTAVAAQTTYGPDVDTVILARAGGTPDNPTAGFADSIAGGARAARDGLPILLTNTDSLDPSTAAALRELAPNEVLILGSTGAINDAVAAEVAALGPTVRRLAGPDRTATAVAIAADGPIILVDGYDSLSWSSGFAAASLAARDGASVLLTNGSTVPPSTATALTGRSLLCAPNVTPAACVAAAAAAG